MNRSVVIIFSISLLLLACTPSYQRLLAYEDLSQIEKQGILVHLPQKFHQNDSIAKLYLKYGYQQKADRMLKELEEQKIWIKTAFKEKYNYSPVVFSFDNQAAEQNYSYEVEFIIDRKWTNQEREREEDVLQLALLKRDSNDPMLKSILPRTFDATSDRYGLSNYRNLARQLNNYFHRLQKQKSKIIDPS
jgi:hypothetical protein